MKQLKVSLLQLIINLNIDNICLNSVVLKTRLPNEPDSDSNNIR